MFWKGALTAICHIPQHSPLSGPRLYRAADTFFSAWAAMACRNDI